MTSKSTLTPEQRQRIVNIYNAGVIKQEALAEEFGVSKSTVAGILRQARLLEKDIRLSNKRSSRRQARTVCDPAPRDQCVLTNIP